MDGPWVCNTLSDPHDSVVESSVTLTTTAQPICASGKMPNFANYFNYVGKAIHLKGLARTTSGATPGNLEFQIMVGNNTANNGQNIASLVAAWTANQSNYTWIFDLWVQCKAIGVSGSLMGHGVTFWQSVGYFPFNGQSPGIVTVDLTQNPLYFSPQVFRSGSTAESVWLFDYFFEALN